MISAAHFEAVVALSEFWDVILSVAVIIGGYMIFSPRFLGQYFFPKHDKVVSQASAKAKLQEQEEEPPVSDGDFEPYDHDLDWLSEDALAAEEDASEADEGPSRPTTQQFLQAGFVGADDYSPAFETDDFMSLWRSSPAGLDEAVEAQLDEGFADVAGPSVWGVWSQEGSDEAGDDLDEDFWAAPPPVTTDPAMDNQALDSALAAGDAQLAGAALGVGAHRCGALWACEGLRRLSAAGLPLSTAHAVELAQRFGGEARADLAADLWGQRHRDGKDTILEPELYAAVLEVCARCMDFEAAAKVAARVGWRSPSSLAGQRAMLALARWLARRQEFSSAWDCYQEVRRQGHGAELTTHKAVLAAVVRGTDMSRAAVVFEDLVASGLEPDDVAFSTMIGGYCATGSLPKAMEYLERMRKYGIAPSAPLFDTVITGCLCCDALTVLEQVLVDMEADGVPPSSATVEALVRYHGRGGDVKSAMAICEEMPRRHGFELDSHAYGALICVCLAGSRLDLALDAVRRMVSQGLTPSSRCYESVVLGCMRQGDINQAVLLVDDALGSSTAAMLEEVDRPARGDRPTRPLEPRLLWELLRLIGRKGQARSLGVPLATRLQAAGVQMSEELVASLLRAAEVDVSSESSHGRLAMRDRRTEHERWRNCIR